MKALIIRWKCIKCGCSGTYTRKRKDFLLCDLTNAFIECDCGEQKNNLELIDVNLERMKK